MKRKTILIVIFILVNVVVFVGLRNWRAQKQRNADEVVKIAERYAGARYAGATGPSIETYDKNISRWLAEMQEESIEVILQKLTDAAEWGCGIHDARFVAFERLLTSPRRHCSCQQFVIR